MNSLLLGMIALGGLLAVSSMKKDEGKGSKVDRGGKEPGTEGGYPIVPKLQPESRMVLPVHSLMVSAPAQWDLGPLGGTPQAMYLGILADQMWLFVSEIRKDSIVLADWLTKAGVKGAQNILNDRLDNAPIGEALFEFDAGLPAEQRALAFWQISAQRWSDLETSCTSGELSKYPKFAKSCLRFVEGTALKELGFYAKDDSEKKKPNGGDVTTDNPAKWKLPNAKGPAEVETPHGSLSIPKGGSIEGGKAYYVVQSGDYSGAIIAAKWGKSPAWANAIAHENQGEVFGGGGNTVFVGDKLTMPILFLDPTYDANPPEGTYAKAPTGGGQGSAGSDGEVIPPKPSSDPGPDNEWVYDLAGNKWVARSKIPYGPPPPPPVDKDETEEKPDTKEPSGAGGATGSSDQNTDGQPGSYGGGYEKYNGGYGGSNPGGLEPKALTVSAFFV